MPHLDSNGNVFFIAKSVRDWTFGVKNFKSQRFIFEQTALIDEYSYVELQSRVKSIQLSIPFTATVHFENTSFIQ